MMHTPLNIDYLHKCYIKLEKFSKSRKGRRLLIKILVVFGFLLLACTVVIVIVINNLMKELPSPVLLRNYSTMSASSHLYDRKGRLLYEIYRNQNRTIVKLKDLPKYVAQATVAIEDKDFYHHPGVSLISGVLRAIKETYTTGKIQGGSTLTQQLVKGTLLTSERTVERKLKEMFLALWTERMYSKDEILEMYLNHVPYGGSSYGIEEAAKTYFSKSASKLTLEEAALLAGLPQAPSLYSPFVNIDAATRRRNDVLQNMYEQGYIDRKTKAEAQNSKVIINPSKTTMLAPHFVFYTKSVLERRYGSKIVEEGGLEVTTTLDLDIQNKAEEILRDELEKIKHMNVSNGAILVTRPPTGEILAMVGSVDYYASPSGAFNVTTGLRQPGSSIKPLNFAVGIDTKIVTAASIFLDVPTCFPAPNKRYCPMNYDGAFHGAVSLRDALANSYNIPAVKMLKLNGVENFVASASAFTITSFTDVSRYGLSLTLGGAEVTMVEMAQAFSAFANQGIPRKVEPIIKIVDKNRQEIFSISDPNFVRDVTKPLTNPRYSLIKGKRAISPETAFIISNILADNNARTPMFGAHSDLVIKGKTVSVKTGTTDEKRDNWTIGYTPNFLVVVWVGNNDNSTMNQAIASGITGASPIWNKMMTYLLENQPNIVPYKPEGVVGLTVCADGGSIESGCKTKFEYFIKGTINKPLPTFRKTIAINKDTGKPAKTGDVNIEMQEKTVMSDGDSVLCLDCN